MYTGVSIKHLIPDRFILQDPASASKSIIKKDILRIPAYNPPIYGSQVQPMTTFKISSPQDFIDFANSYFEMTVTSPGTVPVVLSNGGAHSLFDRIEVRGLGNIQMQEYQQYYLWNAVFERLYRMDDDMVVADGTGKLYQKPNRIEDLGIADANPAQVRKAALGVNGTAGWLFDDASDNFQITAINRSENKINGADFSDGAQYMSIRPLPPPTVLTTTDDVQSVQTLLFRPRMSFFEMMFPLFLSKAGIEIRFYWANSPVNAISGGLATDDGKDPPTVTAASVSNNIQCTSFDFFGCFITPHPDILAEYTDQWQTPEGLIYYLPSVRTQIKTSNTTDGMDNLSFQFNVRSAARMLMVCHPRQAFKDDNFYSQINDIYWLGDYHINQIQARVGAFLYPNEAISGVDRIYEHLRQSNGGKLPISYGQWIETVNYDSYAVGGQHDILAHFVMPFDFARYTGVGKEMCGIDLSTVPVDVYITRSSDYALDNANDKFEYVAFLEYDAYLKLSSAQISRIE